MKLNQLIQVLFVFRQDELVFSSTVTEKQSEQRLITQTVSVNVVPVPKCYKCFYLIKMIIQGLYFWDK